MKTHSERLALIERKIEDAARVLNPILTQRPTANVAALRVHDALNALAAARLELGLLQVETDDKGA